MDGAVTQALVAAMDDCTESVRLATIKAISEVACDEKCACDKCGQKSCCSEPILMQLAKLAYERDETGCYVEPSEDVRNAAIAALQCCCPGEGEPIIEGEIPYEPERERERGEPGPDVPPPPTVPEPPSVTDAGSRPQQFITQQIPIGQLPAPAESSGQMPVARSVPPVLSPVEGHVEHVDVAREQIHLTLHGQASLEVGSDVEVTHEYLLGRRTVATLTVISSSAGTAIARPQRPGLSRRIAVGDAISGWTNSPEAIPQESETIAHIPAETSVAAAPNSIGSHESNPPRANLPSIQATQPPRSSLPVNSQPVGSGISARLPAAAPAPIVTRWPPNSLAENSRLGSLFVEAVTERGESARPVPRQQRAVPVVSRPAMETRRAVAVPRSVVVKREAAGPARAAESAVAPERSDFVKAVLK
jgi:hypothetical protein